ncbi:MAG TPA: PCRF domain-containing protein, partial [Acidobacteriota bacterium]|nr:PCRF domain-containing protein [Acidobacteriota bacterium]
MIEKKIAEPKFWEDPESTQPVLKRRRRLQNTLELADACQSSLEDLVALIELQDEGEDVASEIKSELKKLTVELERTEMQTLLSGEHDASSAILTIHPGAGGTESQDWAEMLMRMYLRWAEEHEYRTEVTDYQAGDEAGVKSVTFLVEGDLAYGYHS